jgi:hypothetical protein
MRGVLHLRGMHHYPVHWRFIRNALVFGRDASNGRTPVLIPGHDLRHLSAVIGDSITPGHSRWIALASATRNVCKQIINSHQGTMHLESTPGVGTTITVEFLLADITGLLHSCHSHRSLASSPQAAAPACFNHIVCSPLGPASPARRAAQWPRGPVIGTAWQYRHRLLP